MRRVVWNRIDAGQRSGVIIIPNPHHLWCIQVRWGVTQRHGDTEKSRQ